MLVWPKGCRSGGDYLVTITAGLSCTVSRMSRSLNSSLRTPVHRELLVWSPYLSRDVGAFVKRLKAVVTVEDLKIHLVPDRINGQFIRTPWTEALQELSGSGALHLL